MTGDEKFSLNPAYVRALKTLRRRMLCLTVAEVNTQSCLRLIRCAMQDLDMLQANLENMKKLALLASSRHCTPQMRRALARDFKGHRQDTLIVIQRAGRTIEQIRALCGAV